MFLDLIMLHRPGICFCHGEEKSKMLVGISQIFISATYFFSYCIFGIFILLLKMISFPAVCKIERRIATEDPEGEVTGSCPWHCNHEKARIVSR